jgi:hypothetical protein
MPATMHSATQTVRYRSKKLMADFAADFPEAATLGVFMG